ncbi:FAD-dependent monooxygenase [Aquabacterium sp. J223]|uniref:FAD-dependent monooxygenase n=1 Tax=Aquabacterium sp. J223 TaxID=2898431 RepID=UPI0021AD74E3|nr:FAD-dependent monooxygenase [Aquabacterium sp. J223]UUX95215.1 FAD-dependent monooxygenase [Aquabacterium sp. J223]
MKVAVVGGGPSGLYLSLLLRRRRPGWDVQVVEQNRPDATFGFGVVLADTGLAQLHQADAASHDAMVHAMRFNHSQTIVQREVPIAVQRNVKGGAIERLALLHILQRQCEDAGVVLHHGRRIEHPDALAGLGLGDADVVVGADGINSVVRQAFASAFGTTQQQLTNHFAWYGTERVFETPALVFRRHDGGHFVAHYYPYSATMSTFVAECDDATWRRLGLDRMADAERQALFERLFAPELQGLPLISNKSTWRQFPVIRNAHWHHGRHVLIGDALTSAHFSIGSGTRIAMTDAIALAEALVAHEDDVPAALAAYEASHRPRKQKLIDASERSYNWYERIGEWMDRYGPEEFVYQFMTRTGRVDDRRLREQFPALMDRLARARAGA